MHKQYLLMLASSTVTIAINECRYGKSTTILPPRHNGQLDYLDGVKHTFGIKLETVQTW